MERELRIVLDLRLSRRKLTALATAAVLLAPLELGSETLQITTTYPAPSGVYNQLVTVGNGNVNTLLVRDGGNVGIGTALPASRLTVNGGMSVGTYGATPSPGNGLIVSGSVGIGTPTPLSRFDVAGNMAVGTYAGSTAAPGNGLIVSGNLGLGTATPSSRLHVVGNATIAGTGAGARGYLYVANTTTGCSGLSNPGNGSVCGAGDYASWLPGVFVEGWSYQDRGGDPRIDGQPTSRMKLWSRDTVTGTDAWRTLGKDDAPIRVFCCPKN